MEKTGSCRAEQIIDINLFMEKTGCCRAEQFLDRIDSWKTLDAAEQVLDRIYSWKRPDVAEQNRFWSRAICERKRFLEMTECYRAK